MPELKLAKLPDRTPVKLTVTVMPDLHQALIDYASVYKETYGQEEPLSELVPMMLAHFLQSDREFTRRRKEQGRERG